MNQYQIHEQLRKAIIHGDLTNVESIIEEYKYHINLNYLYRDYVCNNSI